MTYDIVLIITLMFVHTRHNIVLGVGLEEANYTINEADSMTFLGVEILSGSLELDVSVTVSTSSQPGDTASAGT